MFFFELEGPKACPIEAWLSPLPTACCEIARFCALSRGALLLQGEEGYNLCRMVSSFVVVTSCDVAIERARESLGSEPAVGGLRSMLVVRL